MRVPAEGPEERHQPAEHVFEDQEDAGLCQGVGRNDVDWSEALESDKIERLHGAQPPGGHLDGAGQAMRDVHPQ